MMEPDAGSHPAPPPREEAGFSSDPSPSKGAIGPAGFLAVEEIVVPWQISGVHHSAEPCGATAKAPSEEHVVAWQIGLFFG